VGSWVIVAVNVGAGLFVCDGVTIFRSGGRIVFVSDATTAGDGVAIDRAAGTHPTRRNGIRRMEIILNLNCIVIRI